jgi:hypothetical protein
MEFTLNLPDELADRLPLHEDRLALVLELGLQVLRAEEAEVESDLLPGWRAALTEVLRRRDSRGEPPTVAELLAYHRGTLEAEAVGDLLERLILHPQAARDLLDLIEFEAPDAVSDSAPNVAPNAALNAIPSIVNIESKGPASAALQTFRARVAGLADHETASGAPFDEPSDEQAQVIPFPPPSLRWVGWAAALLLALGSLWVVGLPRQGTNLDYGLDYATIIEVTTNRGTREFPVSETSEEILIVLPRAESAQTGKGRLRVFDARGAVVYEQAFLGLDDPWSRLYVRLPRVDLGVGTFRIEISPDSPADDHREYWFTILIPPPP